MSEVEYISKRISDLNAKNIEESMEIMLKEKYKREYIAIFRQKFKDILKSKDFPSQFSIVPNESDLDQIVNPKLQIYTDPVAQRITRLKKNQ